jgi:hypothetical protein
MLKKNAYDAQSDEALSCNYYRFPIPFGRRPLREELFALITLFENCRYHPGTEEGHIRSPHTP